MEKIYYLDPYLKQIDCRIEKVIRNKADILVFTNKTIFYPECGGQPGDKGTIGLYEVLDTRKDSSGDSVLVLKGNCQIKEGEILPLLLDWNHRYKYMVMHTAQHMLSGLLYTMFGIGTVAVHLGEEYLTIEVDHKEVDSQTVKKLVQAANDAIMEKHKVLYHEMSHNEAEALGLRRSIKVDGDVRIVEIEDIDRIACGGVHVASTSELRLIYCIKHEAIRGHARLYFKCGDNALENAFNSVEISEALALKLTCRKEEVLEKVNTLNNALNENIHIKNSLMTQLAGYLLKDNLKDGIATFIIKDDLELSAFTHASNSVENIALCVVKPSTDKTLWSIVLKGQFDKISFDILKTQLLPLIEAKGGGRAPAYQGFSPCTKLEVLQNFLSRFQKIVQEENIEVVAKIAMP